MILQAGSKVGQPVGSNGRGGAGQSPTIFAVRGQFGLAKLLKHLEDLEWDIGKMLVFQTILTG